MDTWVLRSTGQLPSTEAVIEYICQQLGVFPTSEQVHKAAHMRFVFTQQVLVPAMARLTR
ncbi:MAG TPA: hypothetical protein VHZ51_09235 [Ktedonobacteraceae bacterium]|nr:hypothetical protein [Ktedonobacteraceae bacterium]